MRASPRAPPGAVQGMPRYASEGNLGWPSHVKTCERELPILFLRIGSAILIAPGDMLVEVRPSWAAGREEVGGGE